MNIKVFYLMAKTNETRHIEWHRTSKSNCRLNASVCKGKKRWNNDKCKCECKELINRGRCETGFTWNPSNCECKCDKSCDVGEYLHYGNCKCRKGWVYKLVQEPSEDIN